MLHRKRRESPHCLWADVCIDLRDEKCQQWAEDWKTGRQRERERERERAYLVCKRCGKREADSLVV
jgi:hypothetical protein